MKQTEIVFLLDRSGSMGGFESDTIGGFNSFIQRQCELEGETRLTTVLFDDEYEILWDGVEATQVKLTDKEYYVRGMTALLDAVGKTILTVGNRISTLGKRKPDQVIFVITTDGMENASKEFTYKTVKKLIRQKTNEGWEFIFMGANIDVNEEAEHIGVSVENAYSFDVSEKGVESMYERVFEAVAERRKS
ncbi:VWA domain-containing protein [Chungangia koreensis]|uniref:VWA domain-containing protein n=1 Tax=Chungangia koreensis TaxID=752657 RepID=A0ABV8X4Y9_9LACT